MQRTDKEEERIMGTVSRMLCGLFVIMLAGAACCPAPHIKTKEPASTAKQILVITVDPETGSVVAVQDNRGNTLNPSNSGPTKVGTLTTSTTPITITVNLLPAGPSADTAPGTVGGCRSFYVNGVLYCR